MCNIGRMLRQIIDLNKNVLQQSDATKNATLIIIWRKEKERTTGWHITSIMDVK